ncbi:MAG TPA: heavy metal translocating P-type ATPase [Cytophagales bacterium]|nr:heavy metal translocating P-type ATPase [Cytophagales bacterium]HAP63724.1 heavy metal translocating P-type ATPase [Cytophagales bacterium]
MSQILTTPESLTPPQKQEPAECYHCGEPCREETIHAHDHTFCCTGCQTVYEILSDHELDTYYSLGDSPAKREAVTQQNRRNFLDQEAIVSQILSFSEGDTAQVQLFIPVIHCSACIWLLENLSRIHSGVYHSQVHFVKKEVMVTFNPNEVSLRALVELLDRLGYPPEINLASLGKDQKAAPRKRIQRKLALQIGVAGFAFGNIMLLSLPEYIDTQLTLEGTYKQFFAYLNILLSLPVLLYSGRDYLLSAYKSLRVRYVTLDVPIALGILVLFGRSVWEILTHSGPGYLDSFTGLVFFLLIGKWFQAKTYQSLSFERDYSAYFPVAVTRVQNGVETSVPLKELNPGDQIRVRNQELIPADATLLSSEAHIDYSFITGESVPVTKEAGARLQAGGRQVGPGIDVRVEKSVDQSRLTRLWNREIFQKNAKDQLPNLVDRISRHFTLVVLSLAALAAIFWFWYDASQVAQVVTAVMIVACPCALALTLPFAYGHAMRWLGRWGLYLKDANVVERLAQLNSLVFDKTGTITTTQPRGIRWEGAPLYTEESLGIRALVQHSTHPLSLALFQHLETSGSLVEPELEEFAEHTGKGLEAYLQNKQWKVGSYRFVTGGSQTGRSGESRVYVSIGGELRGGFAFETQYRSGYRTLLTRLRKQLSLYLLSGDQDTDRAQLEPYFEEVRFKQSPEDKLHYLEQLQNQGGHAGMVGDGLNDAGALKQAHVGISLAEEVHHFVPACDAILEAKQLPYLNLHLALARQTRRVVYGAFVISFLYNVVGMSFALAGALTPLVAAILMPLSSITTVIYISLAINSLARKLKPSTKRTDRM